MKKIRVHLKARSYDIVIGRGLLKGCGERARALELGKTAVIVTNRKVLSLHGGALRSSLARSGIAVRLELVPDSEKAKTNQVASALLNRISGYDTAAQVFIVAFGGGVIGDLAGFVAAVYKRGVPYIQIPTTLLAQVDSSIGGKVAIDTPIAKNLIGAFYQPRLVLSDIALIRTLPLRELRNGMAEVIKYGVIKDRKLFEYLEENYRRIYEGDEKALEFVISRSSAIKADLVARDELDTKGLRVLLNYGHTIGHAIEAAGGYSKSYTHGDAIAIGMAVAARISSMLGLIENAQGARIESLIRKAGLPTRIRALRPEAIYEAHLHDKKFIRGRNRFVLPVTIGKARVVEGIPKAVIRRALEERF